MSIPPKCAAASSTTRLIAAPSPTSSAQPFTCWIPAALISSTTISTFACLRSVTATFAPSRANRCAVARPMPLAAPVISAVLPLMERESS